MGKKDFTTFTLGGAESAKLAITNSERIDITSIDTRMEEGFAYKDEGVDAIAGDFDWTSYFEITSWSGVAHVFPITFANGIGAFDPLGSSNVKIITSFMTLLGGIFRFGVVHQNNAASQDTDFTNILFMLGNLYKIQLVRAASSCSAIIYDVDGGHGTPGAIIATTVIGLTTLEDYQYSYPSMTLTDLASVTNATSFVGPMWEGSEVTSPSAYYRQLVESNRNGRN